MKIASHKQVLYAIHLGWHGHLGWNGHQLSGGIYREPAEWTELYITESGARTAAKNWIDAWTYNGDMNKYHFVHLIRFDRSSHLEVLL
jgi:hypothetical protein